MTTTISIIKTAIFLVGAVATGVILFICILWIISRFMTKMDNLQLLNNHRGDNTMKIFKYPVMVIDRQEIQLPTGAQILKVEIQGDDEEAFMWALVDPDAELETRKFRLAGTGHLIEERNLHHIDTFQMLSGRLIWHFFEILPD